MESTKQITATTENWQFIKPYKDHFTADEVIDAYFKGKQVGQDQTMNALRALLASNIKKTISFWETVSLFLKDKEFNPIASYLRIISIESFEILTIIPEKEFLDDAFLDVYKFSSEFEQKVNENSYSVFFSFTNLSKELDDDQLKADGFLLKNQPKEIIGKSSG